MIVSTSSRLSFSRATPSRAERGERLPYAPRGFGWLLTESAPDDDDSQS